MSQVESEHSSLKTQREAWDRRYHLKGRQWGNAPTESQPAVKSGVVLELGVGDGKNLRARDHENIFTVGLDFSPAALNICRWDPSLSKIRLILGDVCLLPIRANTVNQVFAHHVLGHIPHRLCQTMVDEIYRVLIPGGMAVVTVFATGDMRDGTGTEVEPSMYLRGDGIITRYFTREEIILLSRNFAIIDVRREEWHLRIRGENRMRSVLIAIMEKRKYVI